MDALSYKTKSVAAHEVKREWFIVDAENLTLGRMASKIASVLRGKHKPTFTPHADCGDFVIVINSGKIKLTGNKLNEKTRVHYTGYPEVKSIVRQKKLWRKTLTS